MDKRKRIKDIIVLGFALFAMFLGAANIIFPPSMGAVSGHDWWQSGLGFILTGSGLPVLGVLAASAVYGQADAVAGKVSQRFSIMLNVVMLLIIGPLFATPRAAATTVELSLLPFVPEAWSILPVRIVGSLIFFSICLYFILNPSNALDKLGSLLTPVLVIFLLGMITLSIVHPMGKPVDPVELQSFRLGFVSGYQTMDALGAILMGAAVYNNLIAKGYRHQEVQKMMRPAAAICGLGISTVYLGFTWIGASGSSFLQTIPERTQLMVRAVETLAGGYGKIMLAVIIFFACCTTAVGLLMTVSEYFAKLLKKYFTYRQIAICFTAVAYLFSIIGVEGIIKIAAPVLEIIYPVVIILIVLTLMRSRIRYRYVYSYAILFALPVAILNMLRYFTASQPLADAWLVYFRFGDAGFGCFIPAIMGAFFGDWLAKSQELKGTLPDRVRLDYTPPTETSHVTAPLSTDQPERNK